MSKMTQRLSEGLIEPYAECLKIVHDWQRVRCRHRGMIQPLKHLLLFSKVTHGITQLLL